MAERFIERALKRTQAVESGHFEYSSGRHGSKYVQCARLLQYPEYASRFVPKLVADLKVGPHVNVVVGPATGGIILAYEAARYLGARALFSERVDGEMQLRRGFTIHEMETVLVVEDVINTGGSARAVLELVAQQTDRIAGLRCIVNRSGQELDFEVPTKELVRMELESFAPEECPLCRQGVPLIKPGSNI